MSPYARYGKKNIFEITTFHFVLLYLAVGESQLEMGTIYIEEINKAWSKDKRVIKKHFNSYL